MSKYRPLIEDDVSKEEYKKSAYTIAFGVFLLIPWLVQNLFYLNEYKFFGTPVPSWSLLFFTVFVIILVNQFFIELLLDALKRLNGESFYYYVKIFHRSKRTLAYVTLLLMLIVTFDTFFPTNCSNLAPYDPDRPETQYPDVCKLQIVRKLLVCGLTTAFGLFLVRWTVIAISHIYQEKVFRDRILLNKYHVYVSNLLYDGCKEAGLKKGITIENMDMDDDESAVSSSEDSNASDSSFDGNSEEMNLTTEQQFRSKSRVMSFFLRLFKKSGDNATLNDDDYNAKASDHVKLYPLLDFNTFKKSTKLFKSDFTLIKSGYDVNVTGFEAKKRARFIYKVLKSYSAHPHLEYLSVADLQKIFKSKTSATEAYRIYDINNDAQMAKSELKRSFVNIFRESYNLRQSILSSADALSALDATLSGALFVMLALIYLVVFGIEIQSLLTLSLSLILGFSTITGNMSKDMFDSLCFLFIVHPFDIGDKVRIEGDPNVYEVRQIYVLRTEFIDQYGEEVYIPNSSLIKKNIVNLRRSQEQWECIDIYIDTNTPEQKLYLFRTDFTTFLKANPGFFHYKFDMESFEGSAQGLKIYPIRIKVQCKTTRDNMRKADRHHFLLKFIKIELEKLNIVYYPTGPSGQSISYTESEAREAAIRVDHFKRHISTTSSIEEERKKSVMDQINDENISLLTDHISSEQRKDSTSRNII